MKTSHWAAAGALSLTLLSGCAAEKHADRRPPQDPKPVRVATAESVEGLSHRELMGTVVARRRAEIETKVQARVERTPVAIGTRVRAGDLLVEFDTRETRARVQQARALHEQASEDLKRYETLLAQQAVTQQEYDAAKARQAVAAAGLQEAEAVLTYARIVAPFSGTITQKTINEGDLAVPGRPLFTLEDESSLQLVVAVPESQRAHLRIGDSLRVLLEVSDATIPATVEELSPSADPMSRSAIAKLKLPSDERLYAGQFARLLLPFEGERVMMLPATAIVKRGQLEMVFAINDGHRAQLKLVRTGRTMGDHMEILSGLRGGERIVIDPTPALADDDTVEVVP